MPGQTVLVIDDSATILKVVQLVLSKAGYRVFGALGGEEGLRMAREVRPDIVLLDFVMPGMNGYQVCVALSESPNLRAVPVVLMSAKGDEVGERFVKVMGIVAYITKPFSPDAISAVVAHTLQKYRAMRAPEGDATREVPLPLGGETGDDLEADRDEDTTDSHPTAPRMPAVAEELSSIELLRASRRIEPSPARRKALHALREAVALAAAADDLVGDEIADRVRARLTHDNLERILTQLSLAEARSTLPMEPPASVGSDEVLSGDLARVPLTQVLALLDEQRQSGSLVVRRPPPNEDQRVELCFRGGKIDFAGGEGLSEEFLLGNFLLEREAMSRPDLELFFRSRTSSSGRLLGEQLVKLKYITEEDLRAALARQTAERIYEVLRWSSGRFVFRAGTADPGPAARHAALQLSVDNILVEGFRRVDEWHLIEREIDDFDAVFLQIEEARERIGDGQLTRSEAAVLDLVNGRSTVRDIVRQSRMGTFEVSKLLYRLKSVHLIRRRVAPVAV